MYIEKKKGEFKLAEQPRNAATNTDTNQKSVGSRSVSNEPTIDRLSWFGSRLVDFNCWRNLSHVNRSNSFTGLTFPPRLAFVLFLLLILLLPPPLPLRAKWPPSKLLWWTVRLIRITVGSRTVRGAAAAEPSTAIRALWARPNEPTTCCFPLTTATRQMVTLTSSSKSYSRPAHWRPNSFILPSIQFKIDRKLSSNYLIIGLLSILVAVMRLCVWNYFLSQVDCIITILRMTNCNFTETRKWIHLLIVPFDAVW